MSSIVQEMLLTSDDNTAESLVKELGYRFGSEAWNPSGLEVVLDQLATMELPLFGVTLSDGSGLSRNNRLTCGLIVRLLGRSDLSELLRSALPVAGVSGTLAINS